MLDVLLTVFVFIALQYIYNQQEEAFKQQQTQEATNPVSPPKVQTLAYHDHDTFIDLLLTTDETLVHVLCPDCGTNLATECGMCDECQLEEYDTKDDDDVLDRYTQHGIRFVHSKVYGYIKEDDYNYFVSLDREIDEEVCEENNIDLHVPRKKAIVLKDDEF